MMLRNVHQQVIFKGIPLIGWPAVENALITFGNLNVSWATSQIAQLALAGIPQADALLVGNMPQLHDQPVETMLGIAYWARGTIDSRGIWNSEEDPQARLLFPKTKILITRLNNQADTYTLSIRAAYVGDQPEIELAEDLRITQCVGEIRIIAEIFSNEDETFSLDMREVLQTLSPLFRASVDQVMESFAMNQDELVTVHTDGNIALSVGPFNVFPRFDPGYGGKSVQTWRFEGATVHGRCEPEIEFVTTRTPKVKFRIHHVLDKPFDSYYLDGQDRERAIELSVQIEELLRQ